MKVTAWDDTSKAVKVTLDGNTANISAGGSGSFGSVSISDGAGKGSVFITCSPPQISTTPALGGGIPAAPAKNVHIDGWASAMTFGDGQASQSTITIDGAKHSILLSDGKNIHRMRLDGANGIIVLQDDKGLGRVLLDAGIGYGAFGGNGHLGQLGIYPPNATNIRDASQASIFMNADLAGLWIGGANKNGSITLVGQNGKNSIQLDASTGDITLLNADCAEDFDLAEDEDCEVDPGTVMVLDEDGRIRRSSEPYDSRVAGVLSGAGGFQPGLVLDRRTATNVRRPVALLGKVFCKADAQYGAIRAGDLLTTSPTPGHAMKMTDRGRALGSVLGKALRPIGAGRNLIPILVTLQ